jgi:flagellar biosynthesis/type III secretory pathway chaperone
MTEDRPLGPMVESLAARLIDQVEQLRVLERTLRDQQEFITARDVQGLLGCLTVQEQQLNALQQTEAARDEITSRIAAALGLDPRHVSFAELRVALGDPVGADLEAHMQAGREAVAIIRRINGDNRRLLTHALNFVQDLLAAMSGRPAPSTTYESSGQIIPRTQLDVIVDHSA